MKAFEEVITILFHIRLISVAKQGNSLGVTQRRQMLLSKSEITEVSRQCNSSTDVDTNVLKEDLRLLRSVKASTLSMNYYQCRLLTSATTGYLQKLKH